MTKPRRLHKRWTREDDVLMAQRFLDGYDIDQIAEALGRTRQSVYARISDKRQKFGFAEADEAMRQILEDAGEHPTDFRVMLQVDIRTGEILLNRMGEVLGYG